MHMKKTFHIPNISCQHCIKTIENELSEQPGFVSISGDAAVKNIVVEWNPPLNEARILEILKDINYPAQ